MSKLLENFVKFGVPLHSNMDAQEMSDAWEEVDPEIKKNNRQTTLSITDLLVKKQQQDALMNTYITNKTNFDVIEDGVIAGAAVIQQQYQYPVSKALTDNAKLVVDNAGKTLSSLKSSIF